MSRSIQLALAAAAAAIALGAQAAGEPPGVKSQAKQGTEAISTAHKLLKTYFDTDSAGVALAAGFNPVGTTLTLNCTNTAGCTIAGDFNAQIAAIGSENAAAICMMVDGGYVNCPYNAIVRAGGGFQVMNYQTFTSVAYGSHTVEMHVYTNNPTTLYRWNKEIKLYKP
ncbi:MAG: hypothetical protein HY856_21665 [Burkholderiales bacterium]|nr:hypothetical protein [Burkholderiales bacterium]